MNLALDMMGGDYAPLEAVKGLQLYFKSNNNKAAVFCIGDEQQVQSLLEEYSVQNKIGLFLSGENGDNRLQQFYQQCEDVLEKNIPIARFKHYTGEFPTSTALAVFLGVQFIEQSSVPEHFLKRGNIGAELDSVLIYNTYKGSQHSFILLSKS